MKRKKVILDTNLWISFLITPNHIGIDKLIVAGKIQLICSLELIEELLKVAAKPKLKKLLQMGLC